MEQALLVRGWVSACSSAQQQSLQSCFVPLAKGLWAVQTFTVPHSLQRKSEHKLPMAGREDLNLEVHFILCSLQICVAALWTETKTEGQAGRLAG